MFLRDLARSHGTADRVVDLRGVERAVLDQRTDQGVVDICMRLFNQYGVMLVNPDKHPAVKTKEGQAFIDWLISPKGQEIIASYKVGGEQLFFPNASH